MTDFEIVLLSYIGCVITTSLIWFALTRKGESESTIKFMLGFILAQPVSLMMTFWQLGSDIIGGKK